MKRSITWSFMLIIIGVANVFTQEKKEQDSHKITLSTYIDGYLSGYDNDLSQQEFQPFITVGARDNTFGVNVAQFGVRYEHKKVRSNLILHWGDIPEATWSSDYTMIQEANVGIKLAKGLWFDAGFFATHIGTESFLPKNNMLSATAFKTFNEPFYQAGAKLSYDDVENWYFELWALNGYNSFIDNNDAKSIGALIQHNFSENTSITYTNLYGRESADSLSIKQNRFYQNLYINQNWNDKLYVTVGFDYGLQTNSDLNDQEKTVSMYAGIVTARYKFDPKWSVSGRAEIFRDENGFISGTTLNTNNEITGYKLTGYTLGAEYRPVKNSYLRVESRYTNAAEQLEIFLRNNEMTNHRLEFLITMGLELEKIFGF